MISQNNKIKLYIITLSIDFFLICTILNYKLNIIDQIWCSIVLISHIMFIYALKIYYKNLLDFLHILIFTVPLLTLLTHNIFTKIITCILLIIIQILWIKEKRCILNEDCYEFGYGDYLNYYTLILTIILAIQIGYKLK